MKTRRVWQIILGLATILWIAFIFANSAKSGVESGADSSSVTEWLNETVGHVIPSFHVSGFFIRKAAHFLEFALLSVLLSFDLTLLFSLRAADTVKRSALVLLAIPVSATVAMIDEIIQRFSPGRGPSVRDVLIDTSGAATAALLFFGILCLMLWKRQKRKNPALYKSN